MEIATPHTLQIYVNGGLLQEISLEQDTSVLIGRGQECNITIDSNELSREHLLIHCAENECVVEDCGSSNGCYIDKNRLSPQTQYTLSTDTQILLASGAIVLQILLSQETDQSHHEIKKDKHAQNIQDLFANTSQIIIGRQDGCDWVLPSLQVSRKHAVITRQDNKYSIEDLDTTNGTYVNGQRIREVTWLDENDSITIGTATFSIGAGNIEQEYAIIAENIEKVYSKGFVGLNKTNIKIPCRQFVALMGPSGCGKSTLLKGLNGANPVSSGAITIQGLPLNNQNFNMLKKHIGYVPQEDIVHGELSVEKTLYYAAKLRMSKDVSKREINAKIDQVLNSLNLANAGIKGNKIDELSGGQRKRISIAVELLNDPKILFLDEPTSPLDPETIDDFLSCIRGLVKAGQTVIMVTHKPSDLSYVDKVIFLSKGGYQTYFGDKDSMLDYFDKQSIIEVYSLMKSPETGKVWYDRWKAKHPVIDEQTTHEKLQAQPSSSFLRQYYWLTIRYFNIKSNDGWNLALLIGQPIIIGALLVFIFAHLQVSVLFMMAISAVWFGVSNASKEIVSELPIYERERMYNLSIGNYVASKITVLSIIALLQVLIFVSITYFTYAEDSVRLWEYAPNVGFMFLLSVSATIFGLLLSAVFTSTEKVMTFVPIALMPQIMLAGIIAPLDSNLKIALSYFTLGRWGTEGFAHLQDGSATRLGKWADDQQSVPASVLQFMPATPSVTVPSSKIDPAAPTSIDPSHNIDMQLQPQGAMEQLALYDQSNDLLSVFPEKIEGVFIAIGVINLACLIGIYFALKLKDKRFV